MRMTVPLASLATLLDFPAGVSVLGVDGTEGVVVLHLEGAALPAAEGADELVVEITAEYLVDAKGHRSFLTFKAPEAPGPTPEDTTPPAPVTDVVGAPPAPAKAAGATKKAGS